jgi:putative addiction module antidote
MQGYPARLPALAQFEKCYYNRNNVREGVVVELKVRKFGNSLGVVLPKEVIGRLHTKDGERLFLIEATDGDYRLTPYDPAFEKKMARAEQIMARYRNTLHALAK